MKPRRKWPQAEEHYRRTLSEQPDDHALRARLGELYLKQGKTEAGIEELERVFQAEPNRKDVARVLGYEYAKLRKLPEAIRYFQEALSGNPRDAHLFDALGVSLLKNKQYVQAEEALRRALAIDPRHPLAMEHLALVVYLQERYAEAVPLLVRVARRPEPPPLLVFFLGNCYDHLGALPQAIENYERFLAFGQGQNPVREWQAEQRIIVLKKNLARRGK